MTIKLHSQEQKQPIINNCIIVNRDIKNTIINFVYSRELNNVSIWSTRRANCSIVKADCSIDILDFWIIRSKTTHLAFLTHFLSKF